MQGGGGSWWPFGRTRFGLGGSRSRCSLPSRSLRVVRVARAFVSGYPQSKHHQRAGGWDQNTELTVNEISKIRVLVKILFKTPLTCTLL